MTPASSPCPDAQFYSLDAVEVNADGGTVAVGASRPFLPGCPPREQFQTTFCGAAAGTRPGLLADEVPYALAAADGGSVLAYAHGPSTSQVSVVRSDGTGRRQLTNFAGGASRVAMSGDGQLVFAEVYDVTAHPGYHLVRIDVASGPGAADVRRVPGECRSAGGRGPVAPHVDGVPDRRFGRSGRGLPAGAYALKGKPGAEDVHGVKQ